MISSALEITLSSPSTQPLKHQSALANENKHHSCQPGAGPSLPGGGEQVPPCNGAPGRADALRGPPILGAGQASGRSRYTYIAPKPWSDALEGRSRGFSDLHGDYGVSLLAGVPRPSCALPQTGRTGRQGTPPVAPWESRRRIQRCDLWALSGRYDLIAEVCYCFVPVPATFGLDWSCEQTALFPLLDTETYMESAVYSPRWSHWCACLSQ